MLTVLSFATVLTVSLLTAHCTHCSLYSLLIVLTAHWTYYSHCTAPLLNVLTLSLLLHSCSTVLAHLLLQIPVGFGSGTFLIQTADPGHPDRVVDQVQLTTSFDCFLNLLQTGRLHARQYS